MPDARGLVDTSILIDIERIDPERLPDEDFAGLDDLVRIIVV